MIFQSEAVSRILTEGGQLSVPPESLGLTPEIVSRNIFCPAVREYTTRRRPRTNTITVRSSLGGVVTLPSDFVQLVEIKPIGHPSGYLQQLDVHMITTPQRHLYRTQILKGVDFKLDLKNKKITLPWGIFSLTYMSNSQPTSNVVGWEIPNTDFLSDYFRFYVPKELVCGFEIDTLNKIFKVARDGTHTIPEGYTDEALEITTLELKKECGELYCEVTFNRSIHGPLYLNGKALVPYAPALSYEDDELFFLLFLVKFGHAYASAKSQIQMDDAPINFNRDDFLGWVRQKDQEYQRLLESNQSWWTGI